MKRWCWLFLLLLTCGAMAQVPPASDSPSPLLLIPYLDDAPTIDGRPDDWPAGPTTPFGVPQHPPADANRVSVQWGWDEQFLYALYRVRDQHLTRVAGGPRIYFNDAVELYVDAQADSRAHMDVNDYQFLVDLTGELIIFKGDQHLLSRGDSVPKEIGSATLLVKVGATRVGTLNQGSDRDSGYVVEVAVPWAGLGREARAGLRVRLDACCEDMDSVLDVAAAPDDRPLPGYAVRSWTGIADLGFPQHWRAAQLTGGPSEVARLSRTYARGWLYGALALAAGMVLALLGIVRLRRQVRQLRLVPVRAALPPASRQLALPPGPDPPAGAQPTADQSAAVWPELLPAPLPLPKAAALPHQALFEQCRAYVVAHLDEDLSPDDLAAAVAVGLRTLQRCCREELDLTPAGLITAVKLEQAAVRLRAGATVQEAAYATGFADASYFGRVFKKYFGLTPRQWATQQS